MIPVRGFVGDTVAVLGLGRSGLTAARALRAGGAEVVAWDDGAKGREAAEAEGFALRDLTRAGAFDGIACLVTSPGIPHLYPAPHPAIRAAWDAGVAVDNDIGLFFRSLGHEGEAPRVVAITGSNGKSTTAALLHHVLIRAHKRAHLAGNIGRGVLDLDPLGEADIVVLELSSYQTDLARSLTPDIGVFTNLSSDHLDRHAGHGGYFAAKRRLFAEGGPERAVIGVDEDEGRYLANQLSEATGDPRVIRVATGRIEAPGWQVTVRKGWLAETRMGRQVASVDLRDVPGLPGRHNHQNACCAWGAARALGLGPRDIEAGLRSYPGLPHRSQRIAERGGVVFVNDSKATNVDAAAQALQAFKDIRWICGGLMKEGGLDALRPHLGRVAKAYVIGREAEGFALALGPGIEAEVCTDMATAVARAAAEARPGETVLLAPAAASFDQYDSFEARGQDFAERVAALDD
ncbi:UDP-N-acetylmuramoylalanine--D-glutamate ligase [Jannaschia seosinensis]|uniref:UDP-N-acetylmuramoylalanine--D-glutamate ligase n=1 Tax=Jannaschia seosinensis TaxID=313367 RepID=A0A0M7B7I0_9RHOB|nr:UDP-N-acetylmuramoyl-L-alanine--D-glutamate ligase [Jannaschia seosinensis]CUH19480.1 UDP-N-acetylmuramoylalanine--D-glutamate ligase [Jannaschia seosinensis]